LRSEKIPLIPPFCKGGCKSDSKGFVLDKSGWRYSLVTGPPTCPASARGLSPSRAVLCKLPAPNENRKPVGSLHLFECLARLPMSISDFCVPELPYRPPSSSPRPPTLALPSPGLGDDFDNQSFILIDAEIPGDKVRILDRPETCERNRIFSTFGLCASHGAVYAASDNSEMTNLPIFIIVPLILNILSGRPNASTNGRPCSN
jgi:hypothetical protein